MSDETNTYGDDIHLTTTDATTIYNTLIAALEKGAGEPLYPGDERRIFGEGLVAVFVALYNSLDDTGRQTLLRYARGEVLDAIGERLDVHRLEGSPAKTTMRFSVSTPQPNNIIIPKWTKVTPDSDHYFATDEIAVLQAGAYSVEIPTSAVSNGTEYNGYAPGTITTLVDLIPYIESVTNITATAGGDDGEPHAVQPQPQRRQRQDERDHQDGLAIDQHIGVPVKPDGVKIRDGHTDDRDARIAGHDQAQDTCGQPDGIGRRAEDRREPGLPQDGDQREGSRCAQRNAVGQFADQAHIRLPPFAKETAHGRLAAVAHALQDELYDDRHIAHNRIGRDGQLPAIADRAQVDEHDD